VQPWHFHSWDTVGAFLRRHLFFRSTTSGGSLNKPILSRWQQLVECTYAHWLWDNSMDEEGAVHRVMVQCRRRR